MIDPDQFTEGSFEEREALRKGVFNVFEGHDAARLWFLTLLWLHGWVNVFSEALKKVFPWEVTLFGLKRTPYRLAKMRRPVGYWLAKPVSVIVLLFLFGALGELSRRIVLFLF